MKYDIHCSEHASFQADCHWCNVSRESASRMTNAELALHYGCSHERLNEEGICRACGQDCRGIGT